jgi:hypothetical protein
MSHYYKIYICWKFLPKWLILFILERIHDCLYEKTIEYGDKRKDLLNHSGLLLLFWMDFANAVLITDTDLISSVFFLWFQRRRRFFTFRVLSSGLRRSMLLSLSDVEYKNLILLRTRSCTWNGITNLNYWW